MTMTVLDLKPVSFITIDAIGKPGKRIFYLQGRSAELQVTLLIEKFQAQILAEGIDELLMKLAKNNPELEVASVTYQEEQMKLTPPIDPIFRVGEGALLYDPENDLVILFVEKAESSQEQEDSLAKVNFWCTRSQLKALSMWIKQLVNQGRPIWPSTGEPIMPANQFSPKNNGHKH